VSGIYKLVEGTIRTLYNGKIEHGAQYVNPPSSLLPTTYYGPDSGVGLALAHAALMRNASARLDWALVRWRLTEKPAIYFRFYEINSAGYCHREDFVQLSPRFSRADRHRPGRRAHFPAEQEPQQFDVLAVDAFSGDAIPVHLLTREAFALYLPPSEAKRRARGAHLQFVFKFAAVVQLLASEAGCDAEMVTNDDNHAN